MLLFCGGYTAVTSVDPQSGAQRFASLSSCFLDERIGEQPSKSITLKRFASLSLHFPPIGIDAQLIKKEGIHISLKSDAFFERGADTVTCARSAAE